MWVEKRIQDVAGGQHGVIDRETALGLGASDHEIGHRLRTGRLSEMHPGVYYTDATLPTWRTAVLAAVLAAGPRAVASHRCAGVVWGLDGIRGKMIELTVPYGKRPEPADVIIHRTRKQLPRDIVDGIPIATVERTLLQLAGILPAKILEMTMASAFRLKLTEPALIDREIGSGGGRGVKGTRRARQVLRIVSGDISGSIAEVDLAQLIRDAPVPSPVPQLMVPLPGLGNAFPDFAWPDRMRIVEADGLLAHATPEQLEADLVRQNALMRLGWEMRRFTARSIRREPRRVTEEITDFVNAPFCAG